MEKPEAEKPKTDFEDIKKMLDDELEEMAQKISDTEKRKEILAALRNK